MAEVCKDYMNERALGVTHGPLYHRHEVEQYVQSSQLTIIPIGRKDEGTGPDGKPKGRNVQDGRRAGHSGHIHSNA